MLWQFCKSPHCNNGKLCQWRGSGIVQKGEKGRRGRRTRDMIVSHDKRRIADSGRCNAPHLHTNAIRILRAVEGNMLWPISEHILKLIILNLMIADILVKNSYFRIDQGILSTYISENSEHRLCFFLT